MRPTLSTTGSAGQQNTNLRSGTDGTWDLGQLVNQIWLVVFRHPPEKYEFVRLDHHPN
jgi:hypothetical protein